jgi:hypothetical protein
MMTSPQHRFFERYLNNDLEELTQELLDSREIIKNIPSLPNVFSYAGSVTTEKWNKYNVFQLYSIGLHNLYKNVSSMVEEACKYYGFDFNEQKYYIQGWYNINVNGQGKLDWHDHGGINDRAPMFHGYYCVNAEPSSTYYKINGEVFENINKNNRAILSEVGHPHKMGDWDWDVNRITIAYDVIPYSELMKINPVWQHWFPL